MQKLTTYNRAIFEDDKENPIVNILMIIIIVVMGFMLLLVSLCQLCIIDGSSMENTYHHKDSVLIRKTTNIARGDIIVLDAIDPKDNKEIRLIKRAIAIGGDTFKFVKEDSYYYVSFKTEDGHFNVLKDEPYIKDNPINSFNSTIFIIDTEYTLKSDEILFLGDNRNNSHDARYYGLAKKSALVGKKIFSPKKDSFEDKLLRLIYPDPENTLLQRIKNFVS